MAATKSRADHQAGLQSLMTGQKEQPHQEAAHQKVPKKQTGTNPHPKKQNVQEKREHLRHQTGDRQLLLKKNHMPAVANTKAASPVARRKAIRRVNHIAAAHPTVLTAANLTGKKANHIQAG